MKESVNQRFIEITHYLINSNKAKNKAEIASKLQISPNKLSEILSGRNNAGIDNVINLCETYSINYEYLLTGRGNIYIDEINTQDATILNEPGLIYQRSNQDIEDDEVEEFINKSGNKFYIDSNGNMKVEVPLISEPAYATYAEQFFDEAIVKDLPKATFNVDRIGKGNYVAFIIKNDSMWNGGEHDTKPGTEILCRELGRHLWPNFRKNDLGFVLMTKEGIFHKDIKNYDSNTGLFKLSSRNPEHNEFEVHINDVDRIFSVIKRGEVKNKPNYNQHKHITMTSEEPKYPQRYVDVLEDTMKSKDEIIDLLKEKNELLQEKVKKLEEVLKKSDKLHK